MYIYSLNEKKEWYNNKNIMNEINNKLTKISFE